MITRRRVVLGLGAGIFAAPLASFAQQPGKIWRIGFLSPRSRPEPLTSDASFAAFLRGMRDLGYSEGKNFLIEWRFADGKYERLRDLAKDLVRSRVDVIVAVAPPSVQAARQMTTTIPIVIVGAGDPVALGFVASFARPGGNITGISNAIDDISSKYLEFLRFLVPKLSRAASLANPDNSNYLNIFGQINVAAKTMKVNLLRFDAKTPDQIVDAFGAMKRAGVAALIVQGDPFFFGQRRQIAELATRNRMPTIFWTREFVEAGGLMSYGPNIADDYRNAATYVSKILKGANPRDLPVEQPMTLTLAINRKTANALGLKIPQELLLRADEVIE